MKKFLALSLAVVLALTCLTACGEKKDDSSSGTASSAVDSTVASTDTNASAYKVLDETLADEEYAIGFRKADCALRDAVQQALCDLKASGKVTEIATTWFGSDTTTIPDTFTATVKGTADGSLDKVKKAGTFILGLDDSFPPMGYRDTDNNIVGFDIDLAKAVCEKLGVELKLQPIDWEQKVDELNDGNIDCIWNGMSIDADRQEKMNLSEAYMNNRQVVVVPADSDIKTLADLSGKVVAVQKESTAVGALEGNKEVFASLAEAVEVENNVLAMYELNQKTSDAVAMDEIVARYYITNSEELEKEANAAESK